MDREDPCVSYLLESLLTMFGWRQDGEVFICRPRRRRRRCCCRRRHCCRRRRLGFASPPVSVG